MPSATRSAAADGMMRLGPAVVLAALVLLAILMPLPGAFGSPAGLAAARWRWPRWLRHRPGLASSADPRLQCRACGQETLTSSSITTVQLYATALTAALAGVITNSAGLAQPGGVEGARQAACGCSPRFPSRPRWPWSC